MSKRSKLKAALIGYAIGDTLGKGTEFMEGFEVKMRYPQGLRRYEQIYQDSHRSQWAHGAWTNDTEFVLMLGETAIKEGGNLNILSQAESLMRWYINDPLDITPNLRMVISQTDYLEHPIETSNRAWKNQSVREPSNEILGRALFAALLKGDPVRNSRTVTLLTHHDTTCEACATLLAHLATAYMEERPVPSSHELKKIVDSIDPSVVPVIRNASFNHPEKFEIDDPDYYWEVRRSLGIVLWALGQDMSQEEALYTIVDMGGDADTNASLLMALLAMRDGKIDLPEHLTSELIGMERLEQVADAWASIMGWD